ncbi:MAG: DUF4349 domain-containing protein [Sphingobacteriaceae bacterium]|nr:DUF4349 domain-containing protein [Sphingobacteriaceae bacterium]
MKRRIFSAGIFIALIFTACNSNKSAESSSSTDSTTVTSALTADLSLEKAKLVKTADIDFKVKDVYESSGDIHLKVRKFGGMVMHNDIQSFKLDSKTIPLSDDSIQVISSYNVEASMVVRIPSESLSDFVASVASDASIIYSAKLDIEDRSIEYLGSGLKQQSRQKILDKELKKDTLKTDEILQLAAQRDAIIDRKMENLKTDASVRYSIISLHFTQNTLLKKEILSDSNLSTYRPPFYKRFSDALLSGLNVFVSILVGIAYVWPFILFATAILLVYRHVRRRYKLKV